MLEVDVQSKILSCSEGVDIRKPVSWDPVPPSFFFWFFGSFLNPKSRTWERLSDNNNKRGRGVGLGGGG